MEGQNRKKIILWLRWTVIIVSSYLLFFGSGKAGGYGAGGVFILLYIFSNFILSFFPQKWFSNTKFFYPLVLSDTGFVSLGMYLSETAAADFYIVFFLVVILASVSRDYKLLMAIATVAALLYGGLLYSWGLFSSENSISYTLRIPFIFIMAAFYGYIVQTFTREAKQQLAISEDKYRGLFENANDGIFILRAPQFQVADVNREANRLLGYGKEEILQRNFIELFPLPDREKVSALIEEVTASGETQTDSILLLKRGGGSLEAELSMKRIDFGDESFYQIFFRDLTEKRKLESRILESKRNLEAIFDSIPDQLSIQNSNYQILRVNKAVASAYRQPYKDLIGRKCHEAYYRRDSFCPRCPISETLRTKRPASFTVKISEREVTLRISSFPILDEKDELVSVIEHVRDITEEKKLQEQLIQSEKLAGIGILASGMAHEINNPLTGIVGMAEILAGEETRSEQRGFLTDILRCGERISEIVRGLRSYSRTAKKEEQGWVDINAVLEESLRMVKLTVKGMSVEVVKRFHVVENIEANGGEIQYVFTQLIKNAFQAMDGRGGRLILSTQSSKDAVEVKVSDEGIGIPEEHLKRIFDPFFTTKKHREGKGLGLNIVYRIVTKYEGTIEVESKEEVGTTFVVKFPTRRE